MRSNNFCVIYYCELNVVKVITKNTDQTNLTSNICGRKRYENPRNVRLQHSSKRI